jgi:hypothetical protein
MADNLSKAGFSWGCVAAVDQRGQTIWIADAHRGNLESGAALIGLWLYFLFPYCAYHCPL